MGISTKPATLSQYLGELSPPNSPNSPIARLIEKLGVDDYHVRTQATFKLLKSPWPIEFRLRDVVRESTDEEVKQRAQMILRKRKSANQLTAVLHVIAQKRLTNALSKLFAVLPHCQTSEQRHVLRSAIIACARPGDVEFLASQLQSPNPQVRIAAALGLAQHPSSYARLPFQKLLKDESSEVQVVAARLALQHGNRAGLGTLVGQLKSGNVLVRVLAAATLRQVTGMNFGFVGYVDGIEQDRPIQGWREWVAKHGKTAKLETSLVRKVAKGRDLKGHTLLAYGNSNDKVVEFDLDGQEIWNCHAKSPRAAEKLANGNVLISELTNNRVIEVNRAGEIVWQAAVKQPLTVYPLTNGNILVAQFSEPSQAIEINRLGEVVWRLPVKGNCCSAFPTNDGNTLIAAYGNQVFEVENCGKQIWSYAEKQCHGSRRLENGNVLVSIQPTGRVLEINRAKKVVWEFRHHGAVDAFRLPNGNTLVSGHSQAVEVTPQKRVIWVHGGFQYGTARR